MNLMGLSALSASTSQSICLPVKLQGLCLLGACDGGGIPGA